MILIPHPSPNFGPRRGNARPDLVVLHYTAMASADAAAQRLSDPAFEVSAHYLIAEDGRIFALVPEEMRAWHAGQGAWGRVTDVNSHSIGIELANSGDAPYPAPQMAALAELLGDIRARWAIPPERVIGHSDCAPGRKIDPGPLFDWPALAREGHAVRPASGEAPPDTAAFLADLRAMGYTAPVPAQTLLQAFRLRFFPGAEGPLRPKEAWAARDLSRRYPIDRNRLLA
jgi:N-acetylmuramoyl-L-alanine amidase